MKKIYDTETETDIIDIEERDVDEEWILVENANGYGGADITICNVTMTWKQLDKLKEAIKEAEQDWRK